MPNAEHSFPPACPRCGYDLGGAVAAWNGIGKEQSEGASCPLDGVCSECGYGFLWRDLLNPRFQSIRGFYEHANTWRERIAWGLRTTLWLVFPWVFWGKIGMHHERRPWRVLRLVAWMVAASTLLRAALVAGIVLLFGVGTMRRLATEELASVVMSPIARVEPPAWSGSNQYELVLLQVPTLFPMGAALIGLSCGWIAFMLWVLPQTRLQSRLHSRHVWNMLPYTAFPIGIAAIGCGVSGVFGIVGIIRWQLSGSLPGWLWKFTDDRWWVEYSFVFGFLWLSAFWISAVARCWRLRHGLAVCVALSIGASVFAAVVACVVFMIVARGGEDWILLRVAP